MVFPIAIFLSDGSRVRRRSFAFSRQTHITNPSLLIHITEQNQELRQAWDFVEHTGISIFLTGKAGTGKTTFLKTVVEQSTKRLVVVAPTGVAAINAGGVTIHSFFQLPLSPFVPGAHVQNRFDFSREKRKILRTIDMLIIDEISMVRADLLDAIDSVLRRYRDHSRPFGGVQLLMIGDLQQLTPVVTPEDDQILRPYYATPYFFGSHALHDIRYVTIQLTKVYRQQDDTFIRILNDIRDGHPTAADLQQLNARCNPQFQPRPEDGYIRLTTHNRLADNINERELLRLHNPIRTFDAQIDGTFPDYAYPTDKALSLKVGAQVMFLKNDAAGRYYNGRIGRVTAISSEGVRVHCPGDAEPIDVEPQLWENTKYTLNAETHQIEANVQGTFKQLPLRLAWAITIHKSQGLTFEHAIIDASLSFAPGQVYVALSRCKTLEGMVLSSPVTDRSVINDARVSDYISRQHDEAEKSIAELPALKQEYYRHELLDLFDFYRLLQAEDQMMRLFIDSFGRQYPQLTNFHKQTADALTRKVMVVNEKWRALIQHMPQQQLHDEAFLARVQKSCQYYAGIFRQYLGETIEKTKTVKPGNKQAAKRFSALLDELEALYVSTTRLLVFVSKSGFTIPVYMKAKQIAILGAMDRTCPPKEKKSAVKRERKPRPEKGQTQLQTLMMLRQGKGVPEISVLRGLAPSTVYGHLRGFIRKGELTPQEVIGEEKTDTIERAISKIEADQGAQAIQSLCPPDIEPSDIYIVLAAHPVSRQDKPFKS